MQQTIVQLIFENWQKLEIDDFYEWMFNNEATLLREEKEQIIDAWDNGAYGGSALFETFKNSENYFLKNYQTNETD